ncbi:MAG: transcriptional repressor, partial [Chloroflexota bacterium]|nr:transcriptional repressor [Chloroflexota bacterium]
MKLDSLLTTLKKAGHRITPQRRTICGYLATTDQHPTPSQVYTSVVAAHPEVSRATVYNTLNALQRLGAIVEINVGSDHTHYDTNPAPHVNLICLHCHTIIDAPGALPAFDWQAWTDAANGFQPVTAHVDILG